MILNFTIGNFLSYHDYMTLDMSALKKLNKNNERYFTLNDRNILKSTLIYGANASGKSNLLKGLNFMVNKVLDRMDGIELTIEKILFRESIGEPIYFKFDKDARNKPSYFDIEFIKNDKKYSYGFEVLGNTIIEEWLWVEDKPYFERKDKKIHIQTKNKEFRKAKHLIDFLTEENLFIKVCSNFNIDIAKNVIDFFSNISININNNLINDYVYGLEKISNILKDSSKSSFFFDMLNSFDFKFNRLKIKDKKKLIFETIYRIDDEEITLNFINESEGTKKFLPIIAQLVNMSDSGGVIIIDELDTKIHPLLLIHIVNYINSHRNNKIQLIASTHDITLLRYANIDRDQIYLTERKEDMATVLYSLSEYKIRKEHDIEKRYLQGRYGAIPFLEDINI